MKVAFGLKAHSGWAALIVLGMKDGGPEVVDRRRIELIEEKDAHWARQPYHAAEELSSDKARDLVERGIEAARRTAVLEMKAAIARTRNAGHAVAACGILVGEPMPGWTVAEILAVHFRMHKAEGVLFRDVLVRAARACKVRHSPVPEKLLVEHAGKALGPSAGAMLETIATLGRSMGPPWGRDQKDAALAAVIALQR